MQNRPRCQNLSLTLAVMLLGCSTSRQSARTEERSLYVHVNRGQCVGIELCGSEVVGGFMAGGGPVFCMAWPMTVLERVDKHRYSVECSIGMPGKMLTGNWMLQIQSIEDWHLEFTLRREGARDDKQVGGLAVCPERVRSMLAN